MTSPASARPKTRASSFDPNQSRDSRGRWRSGDAQKARNEWTNLRSNAGSPASLPVSTSDIATRRAQAKQSSRAPSRASSVGGRSVKSIPEDVAVQQGVSPVPPKNDGNGSSQRAESPAPKDPTERFDMTLNDSPPQMQHGDLMDQMQNDLDETRSVVSNSSSMIGKLCDVAGGLIQSMGTSNPWQEEPSLENSDAQSRIPKMPFASVVNADEHAAQSATAVDGSMTQNNEPVVETSTSILRGEMDKLQQFCYLC